MLRNKENLSIYVYQKKFVIVYLAQRQDNEIIRLKQRLSFKISSNVIAEVPTELAQKINLEECIA